MGRVGFPIPDKENENRRAMLPPDIVSSTVCGQLVFEQGYGRPLGFTDDDYRAAGALVGSRADVCGCPIICNPKPMLTDPYFQPGRTLFGWIHAVQGRAITDLLVRHRMTAIAWEDMFEEGRHSFWRNNEISGEAAVLHAILLWGRMPDGAAAAVIGRGNAARGAIRTLDRLGCNVTIYDRRTSALLRREIGRFDIVVNAVLWDVFRTDHLVYEDDLPHMKPESVIIDISCDERMGIESSRPTTIERPTYMHKGILHYVVDHTPALLYKAATTSVSQVVGRFLPALVIGDANRALDSATIIRDGEILDDRITRFQKR